MKSTKHISTSSFLTYILVVLLLIVVAYVSILHTDFILDDIPAILNNPTIGDADAIFAAPLYFLRPLTLYVSYLFGGLDPFAYHILNVVFHFCNALLLFLIVRRLMGWEVAWIAGAMFAVHPILSESITWISALPYPQYAFFFLLSFYSYIRARKKTDWRWYAMSLLAFVLSLLSAEKAVVLPIILAAYEISFDSIKKTWKKLVPHFILAILGGGALVMGIGARLNSFATDYQVEKTFTNPFINTPYSVASYLKLIIWPIDLTIYHADSRISTLEYGIHVAVFMAFLALLGVLYFKSRKLFFWLSFFFISLWPTYAPVAIAWIVAERYVYLGTAGVLVVLAYPISLLVKSKKYQYAGYGIAVGLVGLLLVRTIVRNQDWQNQDALWIATANVSPNYHVTHNNLGDMYGRHGDIERAIREFTIATQIKPDYSDGYHNLGNTYMQIGEFEKAKPHFEKAIELRPNLWQSHTSLASIYFRQGELDKAREHIEAALKILPGDPGLLSALSEIDAAEKQ